MNGALILLPRDLHTIKKETFLHCEQLKSIYALFGVNTISYGAFKGCSSLESLEIQGSFDTFEKDTFSDANGLEFLSLWTRAESLYFPPDGFQDTYLQELSLLGDFEPIVKSRNCLPEDVRLKAYNLSKPHLALGYFFDVYPIV